jgi:hypothetical protein
MACAKCAERRRQIKLRQAQRRAAEKAAALEKQQAKAKAVAKAATPKRKPAPKPVVITNEKEASVQPEAPSSEASIKAQPEPSTDSSVVVSDEKVLGTDEKEAKA